MSGLSYLTRISANNGSNVNESTNPPNITQVCEIISSIPGIINEMEQLKIARDITRSVIVLLPKEKRLAALQALLKLLPDKYKDAISDLRALCD